MHASIETADSVIAAIIGMAGDDESRLAAALEDFPAPIYITDAQGIVRHFNTACIDFAGRVPNAGQDRWCVTWKLFTEEGEFLPHHLCPMAVALKSKKAVRGVSAVAERPDGSRVSFVPFPTPIFSASGELAGAVNLLVDVTDIRQVAALRMQAEQCRRLAWSIADARTAETLNHMASEYAAKAASLEARRPAAPAVSEGIGGTA